MDYRNVQLGITKVVMALKLPSVGSVGDDPMWFDKSGVPK